MDLIADGPSDNRSTGFMNHDKLSALEEMLRAVEGNDWFDPIRAAEVYLVPNIMVSKDFRVPKFVKYTSLECLSTHLRSYAIK
jgi:hypothetical protein